MTIPTLEQLENAPVRMGHDGQWLQRDFEPLIKQRSLLAELQRYAWHRVRPGQFIRAVLEDRFKASSLCIRYEWQHLVQLIGLYLHNHMPPECYGSVHAVEAWLAAGKAQGSALGNSVDVQLFPAASPMAVGR